MTKRNITSTRPQNQIKNKLIHGVAYNSGGKHWVRFENIDNPAYIVWRNIVNRCYGKSSIKNKSYENCTMDDGFLDYQNFAEWYLNHDYYGLGYFVDKDIIIPGNKVYSDKSCCLVPIEINNLLIDRRGDRGSLPIGVTLHNQTGQYRARLSTRNGRVHLGLFNRPQEAHQAYVMAKEAYVKEVANKWRGRIDERVYEALMRWTVKNNM